MKNCLTLMSALLVYSVAAQEIKWKNAMQPSKVFIQNQSQFDYRNQIAGNDILFATEHGPVQILFTKEGLTYILEKKERINIDENKLRAQGYTHDQIEQLEHQSEIEYDFVTMKWKNINPGVEVRGVNQANHYFCYKTKRESITAFAYEKIIYKNLYPHIDVEYVFHAANGIEYNFILHPGADASQIEMKYSDVTAIYFDKYNNLHLPTRFGDIIDHIPHTYYSDTKEEIASSFILKGKTVSFNISDYNKALEVTIDPWTVTPAMSNSNRVFHIESDSSGNAYIYGGDSPFKLQKYNVSGSLQWTFTNGWDSSTYWFGGLLVDKAGNSYITAGSAAEITKVNAAGGQVWSNPGGLFDEYWSLAFNCDETQLMVGGTRLTGIPFPNGSGRAYIIDMNNGAVLNSVKVADFVPSFIFNDPNEIRSVCASPNGNYYFITLDTIGSLTQSLGINWRSVSGYRFGYGSPDYGFTPQGQSIIRATATHIYTMNGDSIVMRDINTGSVTGGAWIPGGGHATTILVPGTLPKNGGMAIDNCGNIFVGSQSNISKFDANLNLITTTPVPSAVYDVAIGKNGEVLACGNGFAASINISACPQVQLNCNTNNIVAALASSDTAFCEKNCIDFYDQSTNSPTSWQWTFPGGVPSSSTAQNPSSICYNNYGNYDVQLIACNSTGCDTLLLNTFIHVFQPPLPPTITVNGDTLTSSPASSYQWYLIPNLIAGATSQTYIAAQPGVYFVVTTDSNGCTAPSDTVLITGVINFNEEVPVFVYPNPASKEISVSYPFSLENKFEIRLTDAAGRNMPLILKNSLPGLVKIISAQFESGMYFLHFTAGPVRKTLKVFLKAE